LVATKIFTIHTTNKLEYRVSQLDFSTGAKWE